MNAAAKCMAPLIHGEGCECGTSLSAWREKPVLFTPAPSPVFTNDVTKPPQMSCVTGATMMTSSAMVSLFGAIPSFETRPRAMTISHFPNTLPGARLHQYSGSNCIGFVLSDQEIERQRGYRL